MTAPLRFKIIPREEIEEFIKLPTQWVDNYLETRPDVLDRIDIWCPNSRSQEKPSRFDLFEEVEEEDEEVIYVFGIYLELFEFNNLKQEMLRCIDYFCKKYSKNRVVFQWNQDNDWSAYGEYVEKYENAWVINFGYTSQRFKRNIIVPFWTVNIEPHKEPKKYYASFIGSVNNGLRYSLAHAIVNRGDPQFTYLSNLPSEKFYKEISASIYTLCPQGGPADGGFSYRFFESLHLNTIPVLLVDRLVFPYEGEVDYDNLCLRFPTRELDGKLDKLKDYLRENENRVDIMINYISKVRNKFTLKGVQEEVYKCISKA